MQNVQGKLYILWWQSHDWSNEQDEQKIRCILGFLDEVTPLIHSDNSWALVPLSSC